MIIDARGSSKDVTDLVSYLVQPETSIASVLAATMKAFAHDPLNNVTALRVI